MCLAFLACMSEHSEATVAHNAHCCRGQSRRIMDGMSRVKKAEKAHHLIARSGMKALSLSKLFFYGSAVTVVPSTRFVELLTRILT